MSGDRRLRPAGPGDLDAIMALETSTFVTDAWSRATMRAELAGEHTYYLVALDPREADGTVGTVGPVDTDGTVGPAPIAGYAGLLAPRGAREADIQTIAVAESNRRRGIGRALVAALLDEACLRGAREVFLEVRADNPGAQSLYRSFGFEPVGVRAHYYQPDDVDAVVMRVSTVARGQRTADES